MNVPEQSMASISFESAEEFKDRVKDHRIETRLFTKRPIPMDRDSVREYSVPQLVTIFGHNPRPRAVGRELRLMARSQSEHHKRTNSKDSEFK